MIVFEMKKLLFTTLLGAEKIHFESDL